jgi:hypothetical protein
LFLSSWGESGESGCSDGAGDDGVDADAAMFAVLLIVIAIQLGIKATLTRHRNSSPLQAHS